MKTILFCSLSLQYLQPLSVLTVYLWTPHTVILWLWSRHEAFWLHFDQEVSTNKSTLQNNIWNINSTDNTHALKRTDRPGETQLGEDGISGLFGLILPSRQVPGKVLVNTNPWFCLIYTLCHLEVKQWVYYQLFSKLNDHLHLSIKRIWCVSLRNVIANYLFGGFGLFVGPNKWFEDITLGLPISFFSPNNHGDEPIFKIMHLFQT